MLATYQHAMDSKFIATILVTWTHPTGQQTLESCSATQWIQKRPKY